MAQRGSDFDSVKTNSRPEKSQPSDKVTVFKFPPKKWITFRCAGPIHSYATGWIKTKKKDGKSVKFPVVMPSYDPETQQFDSTIYDPWYGVWQGQKDVDREDQLVQLSTKYYTNMICRSVQKQMPGTLVKATSGERKSGFKDKDSDTWTPWVAVSLPAGAIAKIKDLKGTNVVESAKTGNSKAYSVADAKYGCDIRIMYDPDKSPAEQYSVQTTNKRTPITEEEQAFLRWDTSDLASPMTKEETKTEFDNWSKRMGIKVGKKAKPEIDEDEDIDSDYEDDELDDEEPVSKKKVAKKPASKSKKKVEEDEDEDFDDSESEDFDDSDSDDDSDFDDEEEDEPAPRRKAPAKPVAKKVKR